MIEGCVALAVVVRGYTLCGLLASRGGRQRGQSCSP